MRLPRPLSALLALLLAAAPAGGAAGSEPLRVVATIGMIADSAASVGGDCVAVTALIGPGMDPHQYEARPSDIRALQEAELVLYLGLGLEGRLAGLLERLSARVPVIALGAEAIPGELLRRDAEGTTDPHVWMDPRLWARTLPVIADALGRARPDCAEAIGLRVAAAEDALAALAGWMEQALASVPEARRVLVTAHDAFGYFGRALGLEVHGLQGLSTATEPAVADIRAAAALVVARELPAVFAETTVNPRTVRTLVEAAAALGHRVAIGPPLFADAMGAPGTPGDSYIGMMVWNAAAIARALGGSPPPLPEALAGYAAEAAAAEQAAAAATAAAAAGAAP